MKLLKQASERALTNNHPLGCTYGALAMPLERHSEPQRDLAWNLGEEGSEIPLHGEGEYNVSQDWPDV